MPFLWRLIRGEEWHRGGPHAHSESVPDSFHPLGLPARNSGLFSPYCVFLAAPRHSSDKTVFILEPKASMHLQFRHFISLGLVGAQFSSIIPWRGICLLVDCPSSFPSRFKKNIYSYVGRAATRWGGTSLNGNCCHLAFTYCTVSKPELHHWKSLFCLYQKGKRWKDFHHHYNNLLVTQNTWI